MIGGAVNDNLVPEVELRLRGPLGVQMRLAVAIDTGFTGFLTLSEEIVTDLRLEFRLKSSLILGDGVEQEVDIYEVDVFWDQEWRTVEAYQIGTGGLLGMEALRGYRLTIDAVPSGPVAVDALS